MKLQDELRSYAKPDRRVKSAEARRIRATTIGPVPTGMLLRAAALLDDYEVELARLRALEETL